MVRLSLVLLVASLAPACAADSGGHDFDVTAAPGDSGKFDAASGKSIQFHQVVEDEIVHNADGTFGPLKDEQTVTINVNTSNEMVVSGTAWVFEPTLSWPDHTILKLSTRGGASDAMTDIAFVAFAPKGDSDSTIVTCGGVNLFQSMALDPDARQVSTNDKTYSFADCGFDAGAPALAVVPVALPTTGPSEGAFKYYLDVTAE